MIKSFGGINLATKDVGALVHFYDDDSNMYAWYRKKRKGFQVQRRAPYEHQLTGLC